MSVPANSPSALEPTEEELERDWTLSEADQAEIRRCRGDDNRRSFAIQLLALRATGRFLSDSQVVRGRIISHISRQLGLEPVLFASTPGREATELEHQARIRAYLGYRTFDEAVQAELGRWVDARAAEGVAPDEILDAAEAQLRLLKVVLPGPTTLERFVASASARAQEVIFTSISDRLSATIKAALDNLLDVAPGERQSALFELKAYPPSATSEALAEYLERLNRLGAIAIAPGVLEGLSPALVHVFAETVQRNDAWTVKRFAPAKRHAVVACFLVEAQRTLLDHVVEMHDKFLTELCRRARHDFEERVRAQRRQYDDSLDLLIAGWDFVLDPDLDPETPIRDILVEIDAKRVREARAAYETHRRYLKSGYFDAVSGGRYTDFRAYWPAFLQLPFEAATGSKVLLEAIEIARALGKERTLAAETPVCLPAGWPGVGSWRAALTTADGKIHRRLWEMGLALVVRDALRSGDLFLPASRNHVAFGSLLYGDRRWDKERSRAYAELRLARDAADVIAQLRRELDEAAVSLDRGLPDNRFATLADGCLKLHRDDALVTSDKVRELRHVIETSLPRVRIEDLLIAVDSWCSFTRHLRPLAHSEPRSEGVYPALLAALVAHGTNLGIAAMGQSAEGITVDKLRHVSQTYLREDTLHAATTALVDYHHGLPLSAVWGEGTLSSSDGQRFGVRGKSLLGAFYPRYFGYYDRAITVLTHVSDQYAVFASRAISCSVREALYVLDGLLENDSVVRPHEHTTDTHGYTEQLFGLCYLCGFSFLPRIKDLDGQQLYKLDRGADYGAVDALVRATVPVDLLLEQWDPLVRVAASLKNRVVPAHVVVQRLGSSSDRLAKALTALGRVLKSIYILRYLADAELRHKVRLQLNRGESRQELARWLFFAKLGELSKGDFPELMNKSSCLSLLSNAVLVWNTVEIAKLVAKLREAETPVLDEDLAHISPLAHRHIMANGTYHFERALRRAGGRSS